MTLYIGLGHRKGVGKDQLAFYLKEELRDLCLQVISTSFADRMKEVAYRIFEPLGLQPSSYYETHRELKEEVIEGIGKSPRQIYIEIGMKMREIYEDVWLDQVFNDTWYKSFDVVIIPDLRFPNEADRIHTEGGVCVRVERPGVPITSDAADDALEGSDCWDYVVVNDGDLQDLRVAAKEVAVWVAGKLKD